MFRFVILFVASLCLSLSQAVAHEVVPSIATLKFADQTRFSLEISANIEAQIAQIGAEHEDTDDAPQAELYNQLRALEPAALKTRFEQGADDWLSGLGLTFDGKQPELTLTAIEVPAVGDLDTARESKLVIDGLVPAGTQGFVWAFPEDRGGSVLRIERPGQEVEARFFAAGAKSDAFTVSVAKPQSTFEKIVDYLIIGFTHILPKGLDHILFVLGLFLLSTHWKPLIAQVTAFTLAHSVTLAMGLYGVLSIAPSIVEPLIALSIVYVAVENIFTRTLHSWRIVIVFLFGLLHGLGFAGILSEIGMPRSDFVLGLISFNVGVELGQLTVIALAFVAVGWAMKKTWYHQRIVVPISLAIAAMGAWWVVERTIL